MPDDDIKRARGYLLLRRLAGDITDEEMTQIGDALGLFEDTEPAPTREPGLRAVPTDWTRRGAVAG